MDKIVVSQEAVTGSSNFPADVPPTNHKKYKEPAQPAMGTAEVAVLVPLGYPLENPNASFTREHGPIFRWVLGPPAPSSLV